MEERVQPTIQPRVHVDDWIMGEFTKRRLAPPHCTPEALARALERERQITIAFRPYESDDPGVYGMLYRSEEDAQTFVVLFRPSHSVVLRRLTLFHELGHVIFDQLPDVGQRCDCRRSLVLDPKEARAEAFAVGAMHLSFLTTTTLPRPPQEQDDALSALGHFLKRTGFW